MIDPGQFRAIVALTLAYLGETQPAMENLLIGTALQESGLHYLYEIGGGPGLGLFQIEPATHKDQYDNWLMYRSDYLNKVRGLAAHRYWTQPIPDDSELVGNMQYACAIAYIKYHRVPEPLPLADNINGLAIYYKNYYNTIAGAATVNEFVSNYAMST